jgi:hypothetical protein
MREMKVAAGAFELELEEPKPSRVFDLGGAKSCV